MTMDPKRTLEYRSTHDYFSSASQLKTYYDCPRKWAHQKLTNPPHPRHTTPALEFGREGHDRWEAYYLDGTPLTNDDIGRTMMQGVKYAPARELEGIQVEQKFQLLVDEGIWIVGFIDIEAPGLVLDWKFTVSLRYAMDEVAFENDPQRIIYCRKALKEHTEVECRWVYMSAAKKRGTEDGRPRTPKGAAMQNAGGKKYTWKDVKGPYFAIEDTVREMAALYRTVEDPMDVPADYTACGNFGGCEFKGLCKPKKEDILKAAFRQDKKKHLTQSIKSGNVPAENSENSKEEKVGLFDNLKTEDEQTSETPAPAPAETSGGSKLFGKPSEGPVTDPESGLPVEPDEREDVVDLLNQGAPVEPAGFNQDTPPEEEDAQPPRPNGEEAPGLPESGDPRFVTACLNCGVEPGAPCITAAGNESKRIHGERKKTNLNLELHGLNQVELQALDPFGKGADPVEKAPVLDPEPEEKGEDQAAIEANRKLAEQEGYIHQEEKRARFSLFVDCRPTKGLATIGAFDLLLPVMKQVAEANEVAHWGLIPYEANARLAQAVAAFLEEQSVMGTYHIDSSSPLARATLDVLEHFADVVVRG